MRIQIGPVPRESAIAWLDYASEVLPTLRRRAEGQLSPEALDAFAGLLDEWRVAVNTDPGDGPFKWTKEEPAEVAEFLTRALYEAGLIVERLHDEGEASLRPPEADDFHVSLVNQVIAALNQEGSSFSHFAQTMYSEWGVADPE